MVWLLRKCSNCNIYTLKDSCPKCGGTAVTPHPAKFSMDEKYLKYKILMKRLAEKNE
jgi:H/ACA ribonucleoprotein complex subunit 3